MHLSAEASTESDVSPEKFISAEVQRFKRGNVVHILLYIVNI